MLSIAKNAFTLIDGRNRTLLPVAAVLAFILSGLETFGIALVLPLMSMAGQNQGGPMPDFLPGRFGELLTGQLFGETDFWAIGKVILAILFLKCLIGLWIIRWNTRYGLAIKERLADRLMDGYLNAPFVWHGARKSADSIRNFQAAANVVGGLIVPAINALTDVILIILLTAVLLTANTKGTLLAGGMLVLIAAINFRLTRAAAQRSGREAMQSFSDVIENIQESLAAIREIVLLNRARNILTMFNRNYKRMTDAQYTATMLVQSPRYILEMTLLIALALVAGIAFSGQNPNELIPQLALFGVAAVRLLPATNRVVSAIQKMRTVIPALVLVTDDLRELDHLPRPQERDPEVAPKNWRRLNFNGVGFAYANRADFALRDIDIAIDQGRTIGIVGSSGAGKSTLVDLLTGLVEPDTGSITLDGRPLAEVLGTWQSRIGFVPQQVFLFNDTLRRNVAFAADGHDIIDEKVLHALDMAGLKDFVAQLPDGLDTLVGERGASLSGGQAQRIGLARALFAAPDILVLDEATSALDNETESRIHNFIKTVHGEKTIIIIAHRISTIIDCDELIFLNEGRVEAVGSFDQLIDACPAFRAMVEAGGVIYSRKDRDGHKAGPREAAALPRE